MSVEVATDKLPPYLGFGTLGETHYLVSDHRIRARYVFPDGLLAYEVDWDSHRCLLTEHYEGRIVGQGTNKSLESAFLLSMKAMDLAKDPRIRQLVDDVHKAGFNTSMPQPDQCNDQLFFYPAGLMFTLRQPISVESRPAWNGLMKHLNLRDERVPKLLRQRPGLIIRLRQDNSVTIDEIEIGELSVPMIGLVDAVKLCEEYGVTPAGKDYQLVVEEASRSANYLPISSDSQDPDVRAYTILPDDHLGRRDETVDRVVAMMQGADAQRPNPEALGPPRGREVRMALADTPPPAMDSNPSAPPIEEIDRLFWQRAAWNLLADSSLNDLVFHGCAMYGVDPGGGRLSVLLDLYRRFVGRTTFLQRHRVRGAIDRMICSNVSSVYAFIPFILSDPDVSVVSTTSTSFAALHPPHQGDIWTGARLLCQISTLEHAVTRAAILTGVLHLGDRRALPLLNGCRPSLGREGRRILAQPSLSSLGYAYDSVVSYWLSWLAVADDDDAAVLTDTLTILPSFAAESEGVVDMERVIPANSRADGIVLVEKARWTFPQYVEAAEPQLRRILNRPDRRALGERIIERWKSVS